MIAVIDSVCSYTPDNSLVMDIFSGVFVLILFLLFMGFLWWCAKHA